MTDDELDAEYGTALRKHGAVVVGNAMELAADLRDIAERHADDVVSEYRR